MQLSTQQQVLVEQRLANEKSLLAWLTFFGFSSVSSQYTGFISGLPVWPWLKLPFFC